MPRPSYNQIHELQRIAAYEKRGEQYRIGNTNRTAAAMLRNGWIEEVEGLPRCFTFTVPYRLTDAGKAVLA